MATFVLRAARLMESWIKRPLWFAALLSMCISSLGACSTSHTAAKVKDPSQVSLSFRRLGRTTLHPIHKGSADISVGLRSLNSEKPGFLRRANKGLTIECAECIDGNFTLLSEKGLTGPSDMSVDEVINSRKKNRSNLKLLFEYEVTGDQSLFPELETSWSNIEYYEQTERPIKELAWLLAPGAFLTVAGVLVMALESPEGGLALLLPGLALDTFGIVQLVRSPVTERYTTDGKLKAAPRPKKKKKKKVEEKDILEKESVEEKPKEEAEAKDEEEPEEVEESKKEEEEEPEEEKPAPAKKEKKKKSKKSDIDLDDVLL